MSGHRRMPLALAAAALVAGMLTIPSVPAASAASDNGTYVVLANDGASLASARAAVTAAGGQVVGEIAEIGAVIATSNRTDFAAAADAQAGVAGVAGNAVVGALPKTDTVNAEVQAEAEGRGGQRPERSPRQEPQGGATRRPAVGHAHDRRDARGLVRRATRSQGRARRRLDIGHRRQPSRHRRQLQPEAQPQLRHRHPARSTVRASTRAASTRSTRTTTATAHTWPARSARRSTASAWPASRPT